MRILSFLGLLGPMLMSLVAVNAQAAPGRFYDPSNAASPTGMTIGYELFRTIGCPGRELFGVPCPVSDKDGDGVWDEADKCPTTPAGRKVKPDGCEPDGDGDGVADTDDKCPATPAGRKVGADGCELDSDGDGVVDALDKCPATPAGRKVNADGCELDSDGDGVVDGADACPTVPAQTADGCPPPAPVVAPMPAPVPAPVVMPSALVLTGVTFDNDQATLRPDAIAILDRAAATLQQWGNVKVEVAGHTDSWSDADHNLKLSQRRAETVRDYLIGKGIAADRLSARGYGEARPVADNATEMGRAQNRRVELVPLR
ncbi:MAG: OmpA family protein [Pseudomonadota bacterium]